MFMKNQIQTIEITDEIYKTILKAIESAIKYENLTGRKLGITGEIGEILVCHKLGLKLLQNPISAGYDAIDIKGKEEVRYQIKSRKVNNRSLGGVTGSFSNHGFDFAVLVILDEDYKILKIYQADYKGLNPILERRGRRNPTIKQFIAVSDCIYKIKNA